MTPRRSRLVRDTEIVGRLEKLAAELPQAEVCALVNVTEKTLRRMLRSGQVDKSQREFIAGRLAQISSLYPPGTTETKRHYSVLSSDENTEANRTHFADEGAPATAAGGRPRQGCNANHREVQGADGDDAAGDSAGAGSGDRADRPGESKDRGVMEVSAINPDAEAIRGACKLAGFEDLADEMIAAGLTLSGALRKLIEHRVIRASLTAHSVHTDTALGKEQPH